MKNLIGFIITILGLSTFVILLVLIASAVNVHYSLFMDNAEIVELGNNVLAQWNKIVSLIK